ncbi:MBOAT, membrane-bound O-acyltransferase family-domain-containing protein [Chytriomyces sp. MP71]|nr:MBOAT, membrane-bound O-acyltransferase family-domain-containing protein [Chytriomyces sp. MP71]
MEPSGLRHRGAGHLASSPVVEVDDRQTQTPSPTHSNGNGTDEPDSSAEMDDARNDRSARNGGTLKPERKYTARRSHSRHVKSAAKKGKFTERSALLDFEALERTDNPMRGFFILFWISMAWYAITTAWETYIVEGIPFRIDLAFQMSERGWELLYSDALMILSCFTAIPLVKLVQYRIVPLQVAWIVNAAWLGVWFTTVVSWAIYNNWKWTQSGAFIIHCIAMLMKQASYLMSNVENIWKMNELPQLENDIALLSAEISASPEASEANAKQLELLLKEQAQFRSDLKGKVTGLDFPKNLTVLNFIDYMAIPTLVYEAEYPRTKAFRPFYFLEKVVGTFGIFFLLVTIVQHNIVPILEKSAEIDFVTCIMRLIVPFMICFMLLFYIIFDCISNAFAELTYFADREFYEDWWNSISFDEYARRWNKPVHEFLLRHVYLETISTYKLSRQNATLLTFLVSSVFHELVMAVTGKRLRPWLFLLQMFQIPLIYAARFPAVRKRKAFANSLFWFGMFLGPPLLGAMYAREQYLYP